MTDEDIRKEMKNMNLTPHRPWVERTPFLHSTGGIFEPYVPPEGDGKVSPISKQVIYIYLIFYFCYLISFRVLCRA